MSVPSKRRPRNAVRTKRSHQALRKTAFNVCPKCESRILPHRACPSCGTYRGRVVQQPST